VPSLPSDPVVEYLMRVPAGRTSREISEATHVPLRKVQKRLRELRNERRVQKNGRRYAVMSTGTAAAVDAARTGGLRVLDAARTDSVTPSVRRPRSLAQLGRTLLSEIEPVGS
jgi:hypothetical protein